VGVRWDEVAVVSAGGILGALGRHGIGLLAPTAPGGFPWSTFAINVAGCAAIGILMVFATEVWSPHRLIRPFLTVGVLGGFTTFSAYAAEARDLLAIGAVGVAVGYVVGTVLAALVAVQCGVVVARRVASGGRGTIR
jgi:CrcB protein